MLLDGPRREKCTRLSDAKKSVTRGKLRYREVGMIDPGSTDIILHDRRERSVHHGQRLPEPVHEARPLLAALHSNAKLEED